MFNVSPDIIENLKNTWLQGYVFQNVWNRKILYVHSSIANTAPCNYLGHDGEFYEQPSKQYKWTSHSSMFQIWFSVDTKTPMTLYHQPVQISFQLQAVVLK
jgi:hypothetical protein